MKNKLKVDYSTFKNIDKNTSYFLSQIYDVLEQITTDDLYSLKELEEIQDNMGMLFQLLAHNPTGKLEEIKTH
jgi:aspartate/tyrosine/aromatic aminotransferase